MKKLQCESCQRIWFVEESDLTDQQVCPFCRVEIQGAGEFQQTFITEEKSLIIETDHDNKPNPSYGTCGGRQTKDKIFLLSIEEVVSYYGNKMMHYNLNRNWQFSDSHDKERQAVNRNDGKWSSWWLRSPGYMNSYSAYVNANGVISFAGNRVDDDTVGVRPALWISTTVS